TPLRESAALMLGVRDLDPAESERLSRSAIHVVKWRDGKPQSDIRVALDRLRQSVTEVYLHIDMDSLDSPITPRVVVSPVPGGISLEDMEKALRAVFDRFSVRAVTLAAYDPDHDQDDTTLRTALRLLEVLGDGAKQHEN